MEGISPVAYIDLKDGDTSGFVRLQSAEGAKAVLRKAKTLSTDSGHFEVALVSGKFYFKNPQILYGYVLADFEAQCHSSLVV